MVFDHEDDVVGFYTKQKLKVNGNLEFLDEEEVVSVSGNTDIFNLSTNFSQIKIVRQIML
jgi:hypothetical protein